MKEGKISEQGTHEKLVSNDQDYRHLISLGQTQNVTKDDDIMAETEKDIKNGTVAILKYFENNDKSTRGKKSNIEEEETNQMIMDERDLLSYSSWAVLLEYFKVSLKCI